MKVRSGPQWVKNMDVNQTYSHVVQELQGNSIRNYSGLKLKPGHVESPVQP